MPKRQAKVESWEVGMKIGREEVGKMRGKWGKIRGCVVVPHLTKIAVFIGISVQSTPTGKRIIITVIILKYEYNINIEIRNGAS